MPRKSLPARLWLRPAAEDREAVWIILDGGRQFGTGCSAGERQEAEGKLAEHIGAKHDPGRIECRPASRTPVSDVLLFYSQQVVPQKRNPDKVLARIERLLKWWGNRMLSDIEPRTCNLYQASRKNRGGARRDLEDLRSAVGYHYKMEKHTGVVIVTLPAKGKPRTRFLTRSEVARLLWYCWRHKRPQIPPRGPRKGSVVESAHFYDLRHLCRFILMGIYTGSRSAPILKASIHRGEGRAFIDLEVGLYYRLPEDMDEADNKRSPVVRLPPQLMEHLTRWREKGMMGRFVVEWNGAPVRSVKTAWKSAIKGAGLSGNPTPHTLRHTAVTWLKRAGESSFEVAGFTGMSERMVENVYGHQDPNFQRGIAGSFHKTKPKRSATDRQRNGVNKARQSEMSDDNNHEKT